MEEDLQTAIRILVEATRQLGRDYFQLPVANRENPQYRERAYCYELYHQIRKQWPEAWQDSFSLGGEVDKRGNPHFRSGKLRRAIPDFIFHVPGQMRNLLIIEVKPANMALNLRTVRRDLEKLTEFRRSAEYYAAFYLIYGSDATTTARIRDQCCSISDTSDDIELDLIRLLVHEEQSHAARFISWS